jgi:hypothetical protein
MRAPFPTAIALTDWPAASLAESRAMAGVQSGKTNAHDKAANAGILSVINKTRDPRVIALFGHGSALRDRAGSELDGLAAIALTEAFATGGLGQLNVGFPGHRAGDRHVGESPSALAQVAETAANASILEMLDHARSPDLLARFSRSTTLAPAPQSAATEAILASGEAKR